jgi:hypothetical protein
MKLIFILNIDQQSTMGSSRRFDTRDMKLQKVLSRQRESTYDASQMASPTMGDRSTRFDFEKDERVRDEIHKKQEV